MAAILTELCGSVGMTINNEQAEQMVNLPEFGLLVRDFARNLINLLPTSWVDEVVKRLQSRDLQLPVAWIHLDVKNANYDAIVARCNCLISRKLNAVGFGGPLIIDLLGNAPLREVKIPQIRSIYVILANYIPERFTTSSQVDVLTASTNSWQRNYKR